MQSNDVTNSSAPFKLSTGLVGVWQRIAADTKFCGAAPPADAPWTQQRLAGVGNDDSVHDWFGYDLCVDVGDGGITPDDTAKATADVAKIVYAGLDWADPNLARRSMELMAQEVMPRVNALIGEPVPVGSTN